MLFTDKSCPIFSREDRMPRCSVGGGWEYLVFDRENQKRISVPNISSNDRECKPTKHPRVAEKFLNTLEHMFASPTFAGYSFDYSDISPRPTDIRFVSHNRRRGSGTRTIIREH